MNIPFPKLFDPDTKSLKKLDDLKKGMTILKNITSAHRFVDNHHLFYMFFFSNFILNY